MVLIRLGSDELFYRCVAHFCERRDTVFYRIRLLHKEMKLEEKSWVSGMGVVHGVFDRNFESVFRCVRII